MLYITVRRIGQISAAVLVGAMPLAGSQWSGTADAAPDVSALIATAEHNTNTVNTLVHRDTISIITPSITVKVSARGAEDEVHNREQDYESVSVKASGTGGTVKTLNYTVDIIFMKGLTYYRTSLSNNQWKTRKGMSFPDPYTGGWRRGRTTIKFPKSYKFQFESKSGGETRVQAATSDATTAGTVDLWISGGSKPYVVRMDQNYHAIKRASTTEHVRMLLGPFNSRLVIVPPSQGTT